MLEISLRLSYISKSLTDAPPVNTDHTKLFNRLMIFETVAMGFRKIGELIVLANLVGHEEEYALAHSNYSSEWNMGRLINRIKAINPHYYPAPVRQIQATGSTGIEIEDLVSGEWMTEAGLIDMNGKCADLLHGRNPYAPSIDYSEYDALFETWGNKLNMLLSEHLVFLADGIHMIFCVMNPNGQGLPQVRIFEGI